MADTENSEPRPKRRAAKVCARKIDKMIEQSKVASRNSTPAKRKHSDISSESTSESDSEYTLEDNVGTEEDESSDYESEYESELEKLMKYDLSDEEEQAESDLEESDLEESDLEEEEQAESDLEEEEEDLEDQEEDLDDTAEEDEQELMDEEEQQYLLRVMKDADKYSKGPKRFNMKDEPPIVNQFYQLLTEQVEDNTIDASIAEFKSLSEEKQNELIVALQNRPVVNNSTVSLMLKILTMKLPTEIKAMILSKYKHLQMMDPTTNEYYKTRAWLDKVVSVPFGQYKDMPVTLDDGPLLCGDFMDRAMKCLNNAVFGQEESKLQILQFIGTKIANPSSRGLSLLLIGPPGIGKTTIIKNGIAKALGWPFQFISLSGDSDATSYTGHQLVYESSHCGKIVNSLVASKSMTTIMMFDELDKISQTAKGEEIMNLLIHLTDPVQNGEFEDKYLACIPIDLSKVMFVFSANDITKIDKVLLDRMIVIDLKGYDLPQKTVIAEQYLLPVALQDVNLEGQVVISKDMLTNVIQTYAKEEKGVRELKRSIEQITQKVNMLRLYNSPSLPYHIKDFSLPFTVKEEHIKLFIKKKVSGDSLPPFGMYM
jgi:ATP-dependent Lon protease